MVKIKFDIKFDRSKLKDLKVGEFIRGFEILDVTEDFIIAKSVNSIKTFSRITGKCISDGSRISLLGNIPKDIQKELILSDLDKREDFVKELKKTFSIINSGNLEEGIVYIKYSSAAIYDDKNIYASGVHIRDFTTCKSLELWGKGVYPKESGSKDLIILPNNVFLCILSNPYYRIVSSKDARIKVLITNPDPKILKKIVYD